MSYPSLVDRRMPYHRDGTVVGYYASGGRSPRELVVNFGDGIAAYLDGTQRIAFNSAAGTGSPWFASGSNEGHDWCTYFFFPEIREVTAFALLYSNTQNGPTANGTSGYPGTRTDLSRVQGSNDTTNGTDGTWETATVTFPYDKVSGANNQQFDSWRSGINAVSFTGGKKAVRVGIHSEVTNAVSHYLTGIHLYGEKAAGETPDDIVFINHQDTPGVEYSIPQDFGDRPLGTTVTHQFRVKNVSATKTANTVNLQCNDIDFAISEDGTNWVTTINIASLAASAESATLYVRCTTPDPGGSLGPRFAEIVATVGSWT